MRNHCLAVVEVTSVRGLGRGVVLACLLAVAATIGCDGDDQPAADASDVLDAARWDADPSGVDADSDAIFAAPCGIPAPTVVVDVSVGELHDKIVAGDPLAVVDVRELSEGASGIIEGARRYPWNSGVLAADHANLPDDVPLFVICQSGGRSAQASAFLFTHDHQCVHNVLGGMSAWTGAGYPTVSP